MILTKEQAKIAAERFSTMYDVKNSATIEELFKVQQFPSTLTDISIETKDINDNLPKQFREDLAKNKPVEAAFLSVWSEHNFSAKAIYELNDNSKFDLKVTYVREDNSKAYSYIELKNEMAAIRWKNLAVEYMSWNKKSGITITEANYWVSKVDGFYIIFKVSRLKEAIANLPKNVKAGGDSMASMNYILPIRSLLPYIQGIIKSV
jgi:hypothetical protein